MTPPTPNRTAPDSRRSLVAWAAVAFTLEAAVLGALNGGSAGLVLTVSSLSGGASDALQALGDVFPFGYAFVGRRVLVRVHSVARAVQPLGAILMLATGGYSVYYWLSGSGILA